MKKINWKIAAFVAWIVITFMVIDSGLKGVSKADWKRSTDDDACNNQYPGTKTRCVLISKLKTTVQKLSQ